MAKYEPPPAQGFLGQYGTDIRKLYRRNDPETSREAAEAVDTTRLEREVHEAIASFGPRGCISDQVRAEFPGSAYSSITARYAALEEKRLIKRGPDKRRGESGRNQLVMRATKFWQE